MILNQLICRGIANFGTRCRYEIYEVLRSRTIQKHWMALDCASYYHRMPQGTMWSLA